MLRLPHDTVLRILHWVWVGQLYTGITDVPFYGLQHKRASLRFSVSSSETSHSTHQPRTTPGFPQQKN